MDLLDKQGRKVIEKCQELIRKDWETFNSKCDKIASFLNIQQERIAECENKAIGFVADQPVCLSHVNLARVTFDS